MKNQALLLYALFIGGLNLLAGDWREVGTRIDKTGKRVLKVTLHISHPYCVHALYDEHKAREQALMAAVSKPVVEQRKKTKRKTIV